MHEILGLLTLLTGALIILTAFAFLLAITLQYLDGAYSSSSSSSSSSEDPEKDDDRDDDLDTRQIVIDRLRRTVREGITEIEALNRQVRQLAPPRMERVGAAPTPPVRRRNMGILRGDNVRSGARTIAVAGGERRGSRVRVGNGSFVRSGEDGVHVRLGVNVNVRVVVRGGNVARVDH